MAKEKQPPSKIKKWLPFFTSLLHKKDITYWAIKQYVIPHNI